VDRRTFLLRGAALAGGLATAWPRRLLAQTPALRDSVIMPTRGLAWNTLSVAAAGDTTLGYNLEAHFDQQLAAGRAREELWPLYFAGVKAILDDADLALVNLECPFTQHDKKLKKNFNFRARPELVEILRQGSVDVVSLANNHLADYGKEGVLDTLRTLDAAGIARFGAGRSLADARKPAILERNGVRIGFLGYYFQAPPDMLEPKAVYAKKHRAGVAGCFEDLDCMRRQLEEDVRALVPKVDVAIPYFHWGKEGSTDVRDYQIELAHLAVDLGCRAVLGAHPHRLQGVELYKGAPIFYSLGNFVFGGNKDPNDKLSAIARIRFARETGATGSGTIRVEADLVPIQITRWPEAPFQPFVLEGAAGEEALDRIASVSAALPATLPQLTGRKPGLPAIAPADSVRDSLATPTPR